MGALKVFVGDDAGSGAVGTYGPNGSDNVTMGYLIGYRNNGYLAVKDQFSGIQAGAYVDENGFGILFSDFKNFRMPHPTKPDKEIWFL